MRSVGVVGGGVIGLSIAWRLAGRGCAVTVYDPEPGRGASHVAAGMLAPVGEAHFGEADLVTLMRESARRWPAFAAELREEAGLDVGYRPDGTLLVARTDDDLAELERIVQWQATLGLTPRRLRVSELREREPRLAPRLRGPAVLRSVIRGYVDGRSVYLVPRADGEVVVGATSEERRDVAVTAGAVLDLLGPAVELVPDLAEYELTETQVGFRPGTPDNAPIIGELRPGVFVASGHYRNGVLLAPVTAAVVADLVTGGPDAQWSKPFGPERFGG